MRGGAGDRADRGQGGQYGCRPRAAGRAGAVRVVVVSAGAVVVMVDVETGFAARLICVRKGGSRDCMVSSRHGVRRRRNSGRPQTVHGHHTRQHGQHQQHVGPHPTGPDRVPRLLSHARIVNGPPARPSVLRGSGP
jgi:hypothetical protein